MDKREYLLFKAKFLFEDKGLACGIWRAASRLIGGLQG